MIAATHDTLGAKSMAESCRREERAMVQDQVGEYAVMTIIAFGKRLGAHILKGEGA
jgi:hypothetical protein